MAIASALALGAAAAGCGAAGASSAPSSSVPVVASASTTPPASPTRVATPSAVAIASSPRPLIVDSTLLAVLPERVDGAPIVASPETAAGMTSDLALATSASAIAVGIALAPGDSGGDDLAVASVIRLRPGIFSDEFFAGWRAAYDAAACAPAGGVSSHRRQVIGSHTADVTACAQGATTYHVDLAGDVLVSITATGHREFGELILAGLRE